MEHGYAICRSGSLSRTLLAATILLALALPAQGQGILMDAGPHVSLYTASQTRGFWFTAPTDFFIVGVRCSPDAGTEAQNIQIMRYNTPVTVWSTTGYDFVTLGYWWNVAGNNIIPCNFYIKAGDIIGVLGARGNPGSTMKNSYGNSQVATTIFGYPTTLIRHGTQYVINDGVPAGSSKPTWTEPAYQISRSEIYYAPPCQVPDNMLFADIVDISGNPLGFVEAPGTVYVKYTIKYPAGASNVNITLNFHRLNDPNGPPVYTASVSASKLAGQDLVGQQPILIPSSVTPGYYIVKKTVNSLNSCDEYDDTELPDDLLMVVAPGTELCLVWPGDVNRDDVVNYGDRRDLNQYIFQANLRASWLQGPARYRGDAASNPLTYYTWEAQPGIPWYTPEGCHMDADGNGVINNFDYIAIKMNWMRSTLVGPGKNTNELSAPTFDLGQNFPNPFVQTTSLNYRAPEASAVHLVVSDMLGREVARLVNGNVEKGLHTVEFTTPDLQNGVYIASIVMVGNTSGQTFTKTIKMTVRK